MFNKIANERERKIKKLSIFISCISYVVFGLIISTFYISCAKAADINVPDDYSTIQEAIDVADNGDVVLVGLGTYMENIKVLGKAITLRSIDPKDSDIVANTIIDGNQKSCVVQFCDDEDHSSVIDGITIQNAKGKGIRCSSSSPTISNCIVRENLKGIYCSNSAATITHCIITGNLNSGIDCYGSSLSITDCIITGNLSRRGGGICCCNSSPTIANCIITENSASEYGGGIHSEWDIPLLSEESIQDLVYIFYSFVMTVDPPHKGIFFLPICIADFLSGVFIYDTSRITNCVIAQNSAPSGAGISFLGKPPSWAKTAPPPYPNPIITNCTITENTASSSGGGILSQIVWPIITNSIIWENSPDEIICEYLKINYSNIQGKYFGLGNKNADPLFVDPAAGDYRLQPGSPCIKNGKRRSDMGAYGTDKSKIFTNRSGRYLKRRR